MRQIQVMLANRFIQKMLCQLLFLSVVTLTVQANPPDRDYYLLKIYRLKAGEQQNRVEKFLREAYLPALHRAGVKSIGVFKPTEEQDTLLSLYVYVPMRSLQSLTTLDQTLLKDRQYLIDGKDYLDASYDNTPYERIETILLRAFEGAPRAAVPQLAVPKQQRVYELRSYEGPTEKSYLNKVKMFHSGEIEMFDRLGFNSMFYGEVLAGPRMPNLMYMTCFDGKPSREQHWKAFFDDPVWKKLVADPQFQHNVSKSTITFLYPADYSDF